MARDRGRRGIRGARTAAIAALLIGAVAGAPGVAAAQGDLDATIRRTPHGIPHITASDHAGIGYGYGYAFAQDNICEIAESYVTVAGERSRHFGPSGSYAQRGNGTTVNNLNSDFFYKRAIDRGTVEALRDEAPPLGPRPEVKEIVRGYVAGYNRYLSDTGVGNLGDPRCEGAAWVRPIEEIDVYRRFWQLGLLASSSVVLDSIGSAQPPTPAQDPPPPFDLDKLDADKFRESLLGIGSNAYGLGKDATQHGGGMVLGNPHFPWDGPERLYQAHLTIPGALDVSGGSLYGVPLVLIGTTSNFAWSHTVSTAFRFTPFELKLVPGSPTTYLVDGKPREMTRDRVTVQVKNASGGLEPVSRTLYSSEHGPIFTSILGLPIFPWTPATAFAIGDANWGNFRYLNHFFETNHAQSVREYHDILGRNQGIPWVNSIGADSSGEAYYADRSVVPHVTDEHARVCNSAVGQGTFAALGLPVLDGSRSACNWGTDDDAVVPGILGPGKLPHLFRDDYVTNSNDSYWLSNPDEPLEGFDRIIGAERTARSLRTRLGLRIVQQRLDGSDGLPGTGFTVDQLEDAVFNNRQHAGELFVDELVEFCRDNPVLVGSSPAIVNVSEACDVLAGWDRTDNLDSPGAILFRRFVGRALGVQGGPYDEPFDVDDPVNTPRGLRTEHPQVGAALADAVKELRDSNIPLDAKLRDYQYEERNGVRIPIHGGPGSLGVFNAINVPWVAGKGYPNVPSGSSFVQAVRLAENECPDQRTIVTYSQSTNPNSPHFGDQTELFSRKEWVHAPFCEADVAAETVSATHISE